MRPVLWLAPVAFAACTPATAQPDRTAEGKQAFATVHAVFLHPRCRNCHPAGDAPLQYADGRPHAQNITRRSEKNGLPCATCHRDKNGTRPNQPPGAPHWHLPPSDVRMVFEGRTPRQLCEQLKDPTKTGGRDLARLITHVQEDPLVSWGWSPGPGRDPVPIPRPQLVDAMKTWVASGAPCPD
ncbi:MAG: hypothetical protein KF773_03480 [Deltaproteobacteria bacterium]|nr:hypothetical protein [Deltaproteobacteria bacterium]MCW5801634.1 hypothetical protein [Deltaproteobacteria bacterium]